MTAGAGWLGPAGCVASADGFWVGTEFVDAARTASGLSARPTRGTVLLNIVVGDKDILVAQNGKSRDKRDMLLRMAKVHASKKEKHVNPELAERIN